MTAAGERLQRYAQTISDLWRQARQETALPDGLSGICNIACAPDLWPGLGEVLFGYLRQAHPHMALSVWQGSEAEMADWLGTGRADLALTYRTAHGPHEAQFAMPADQLALVSTRPDSPVRFDPGYVFVEAGAAFGRTHAEVFADANTAQISFGSAERGMAHLLDHGGSAYLPLRMAAPYLATGQLHRIADAPGFQRAVYLTVNIAARDAWGWFDAALARLQA
jgi:DNA-binding transcriptional LysR family regulator